MNNFIITAFADEIDSAISKQIAGLKMSGISHIEVRGVNGKNISEVTLEEAEALKRTFDKEGILVSSIGSPIGKIKITDPFDKHLKLFDHILQVAEILEAPFIRMFSFFINEEKKKENVREEVIKRWKQFLQYAEKYPEITLLHENEKGIFGDEPERCLKLIEELNSPQLKIVFDPANFVQCDVEVFPKAYTLLREYIAYVHIKDAQFSDQKVYPAGFGDGKIPEILNALAKSGYRGFLSLEPHLSHFDGFNELEGEGVQLSKNDNIRAFNLAVESLQKIITNMDQEWK